MRRFGRLTDDDREQLERFVAARSEHFEKLEARAAHGGPPARVSGMLGVFCAAPTVEAALASLTGELSPEALEALRGALAWFRPKYEQVWAGGRIPNAFLESARADPGLPRLEKLLASVVRFYGVDAAALPPPRVALMPVPPGYGTHAEAIGDVLLLEIRPGEKLADEASVLVHENAHFLWAAVPAERQQRLAAFMRGLDATSVRAWGLFGEAVPTALGQGMADATFRPGSWSLDAPWYHVRDVDECAKRIYPAVRYAVEAEMPYDERFLLRAAERLSPSHGMIPH